jgi:hypothetical protein
MDTPLLTSVVDRLLALPRDQWPALAMRADVPLPTIAKIAYRQIKEPGVNKIERLHLALSVAQSQEAA